MVGAYTPPTYEVVHDSQVFVKTFFAQKIRETRQK